MPEALLAEVRPGDRWISRMAGVTVAGLVGDVAGMSLSYSHMRQLARGHGQAGWHAHAFPLSVDGVEIVASLVLLADRRAGRRSGWLPWTALAAGTASASLAANIATAAPGPGQPRHRRMVRPGLAPRRQAPGRRRSSNALRHRRRRHGRRTGKRPRITHRPDPQGHARRTLRAPSGRASGRHPARATRTLGQTALTISSSSRNTSTSTAVARPRQAPGSPGCQG